MFRKRVIPVLLLLVPLAAAGGLMKDSTCDTIRNQLSLIAHTVQYTSRNIQQAPFYTGNTVDARLRLLLDAYHNRIAEHQQYVNQVSTFVQGKLKQFSIPVDGLEDNVLLLERIFIAVNDRNAFHRLQVIEQKQSNLNVTSDITENQSVLETIEQQSKLLRARLAELNQTLAQVQTENKKLEAKIHENPTSIRG